MSDYGWVDGLVLTTEGGHDARRFEFTAIDLETTALQPGRVIEIGAVRIQGDGTVLAELSTLVDPGPGIDPGASWVHRISRTHLDGAPSMADVAGDLIELCRDSIVVAHNLSFEERFLAREFAMLNLRMPAPPGICSLAAARAGLNSPNYKLGTVVNALGLPAVATHAALDDARACAALVACLVGECGLSLSTLPNFRDLPVLPTAGRCAPRASKLRAGQRGWMANLMDRLPIAGRYLPDPALELAYLDLLTDALADGRIIGPEAKALAAQAREAGMSAADVRRVHAGVIEAMRALAERDEIITEAEARDLREAAAALGVPELTEGLVAGTATRF
jgi:DNA polymerase-3 subunit epsilon